MYTVILYALAIYSQSISQHNELGGVVEHNADALIAQLVAEAILVAVIHPFPHPHQRLGRRIAQFIR